MVIEADVGAMRNRLRLASKCIPMRYGVATHLGAKTTSDRPRSRKLFRRSVYRLASLRGVGVDEKSPAKPHSHIHAIESFFTASFAMRQKTPQSAAWRQ